MSKKDENVIDTDVNKRDEVNSSQTVSEGVIDDTPEFYWNLGNMPSAQRLRDMDVNVRIPFILEFLSGTCKSTTVEIKLKEKYKVPPLVTGLLLKASGKCIPLYPDNQYLYATKDTVYIGTLNFPVAVGDKYNLKVYNLDLEL